MAIKKEVVHSRKMRKTPTKKKKLVEQKVEEVRIEQPTAAPVQKIRQKKSTYFSVGRRKCAIARVYYYVSAEQEIVVNTKPYDTYFPTLELRYLVLQPFIETGIAKGKWVIKVTGGGKNGQAEAVRLGIARLISQIDPDLKSSLKHVKLLTRDPRVKERKKYGLKRARRAPQWQKR
jgi:small subunit ribosomal protein S9